MANKNDKLPKGIVRKGDKWMSRRHHQGLRISRTFSTLAEAKMWLAEQDLDIQTGRFQAAERTNSASRTHVTFAEFADSSIGRRNLTEKTR